MTKTTQWQDENVTVATEVYRAVRRIGVKANEVDVQFYRNGREGGYRLDAMHLGDPVKLDGLVVKTAVFTQSRNSDDTVVYLGTDDDFDEDGVPEEGAYVAARSWRFGKAGIESAAKAIARHLSSRKVR